MAVLKYVRLKIMLSCGKCNAPGAFNRNNTVPKGLTCKVKSKALIGNLKDEMANTFIMIFELKSFFCPNYQTSNNAKLFISVQT